MNHITKLRGWFKVYRQRILRAREHLNRELCENGLLDFSLFQNVNLPPPLPPLFLLFSFPSTSFLSHQGCPTTYSSNPNLYRIPFRRYHFPSFPSTFCRFNFQWFIIKDDFPSPHFFHWWFDLHHWHFHWREWRWFGTFSRESRCKCREIRLEWL